MQHVKEAHDQDMVSMRENIRRAVASLDLCWRCQCVSECQKYVLGNMVLVWLCGSCIVDLHQPQRAAERPRVRAARSRKASAKLV
jgi:hypothetical protein